MADEDSRQRHTPFHRAVYSENPEPIRDLAPGEEGKYVLLPSVVGAVVPVVNLPGFPREIEFTPEALAGIFLGKIKKWKDPILRQSNRGVQLPDLDIVVVHRSDGSGTSFAWTDFLSKTNPEWKAQVGSSLAPRWPVGRGADGNEGVAETVKEIGGSIGYVEYIYALQHHLSFGKVRNRNREFVGASLESIAVSASRSYQISDDLKSPSQALRVRVPTRFLRIPGLWFRRRLPMTPSETRS